MKKLDIVIIANEDRREAIRAIVRHNGGFTIAGEVASAEALRLVARLAPDVVILDSAMPQLNPLAALHMLTETDVIALAATNSPTEKQLLLELGALAVAHLEQPETVARALEQQTRLAAVVKGNAPLGGLFGGAGQQVRPAHSGARVS